MDPRGLQQQVDYADDLALCASCGSTSKTLSRCTGCYMVWYCGKVCQSEHWRSRHRRMCARLPASLCGKRWSTYFDPYSSAASSPILSGATDEPEQGRYIYRDTNVPDIVHALSEVSDDEGALLGHIPVDHLIFAQLFVYAAMYHADIRPSILSFGTDSASVWDAYMLGIDTVKPLNVLALRDKSMRDRLEREGVRAFSQFVFGPYSGDVYLGLADTGPMRLTVSAWKARMYDSAFIHLDALLKRKNFSAAGHLSAALDLDHEHISLFTSAPG